MKTSGAGSESGTAGLGATASGTDASSVTVTLNGVWSVSGRARGPASAKALSLGAGHSQQTRAARCEVRESGAARAVGPLRGLRSLEEGRPSVGRAHARGSLRRRRSLARHGPARHAGVEGAAAGVGVGRGV